MYKVIVVGTDGSERAGTAVKAALALAKVSGSELHAVNVVHAAVAVGFTDSRAGQDQVNTMREEAERDPYPVVADAEAEGVPSRSTIQAGMQRRHFSARQRMCRRTSSSSATGEWAA